MVQQHEADPMQQPAMQLGSLPGTGAATGETVQLSTQGWCLPYWSHDNICVCNMHASWSAQQDNTSSSAKHTGLSKFD
jgi:hypothetical protein